eukprot:795008_1
MEDIEEVTNDELKEIGFKMGTRKRILKAIKAYFREFEEECKDNGVHEESKEDMDVAINKQPDSCDMYNALIICIGIALYDDPLDNLDTANDIKMYRDLFEK